MRSVQKVYCDSNCWAVFKMKKGVLILKFYLLDTQFSPDSRILLFLYWKWFLHFQFPFDNEKVVATPRAGCTLIVFRISWEFFCPWCKVLRNAKKEAWNVKKVMWNILLYTFYFSYFVNIFTYLRLVYTYRKICENIRVYSEVFCITFFAFRASFFVFCILQRFVPRLAFAQKVNGFCTISRLDSWLVIYLSQNFIDEDFSATPM